MHLYLFAMIMILVVFAAACSDKKDDPPAASNNTNTPAATANKPNESNPPNNEANGNESAGYNLPIVTPGSATLSIGTYDNWYTPKSYASNLPVFEKLTEITGVNLEWDVLPPSQFSEVMRVRLAAGQSLPDIIYVPGSPVTYGADGLLLDLTDLIEEHAPNIKKFLEDFPELAGLMKSPDGNMYSVRMVTVGSGYTDPRGILIKKDWLDELGLDEPVTLDDWYNVLKAFKEDDPNRNGERDEIPLSLRNNFWGIGEFGSAFGFHMYSDYYSVDANGNIIYDWAQPYAKDFLLWMNMLYSEGLLDNEYLSITQDQIFSKISRSQVGVTNHFLQNATAFEGMQRDAGDEDAEWIITVPPKGPGGQHYELYGPLGDNFAITKDAKDPVLAIQWLDYMYATEEGNRLMTFGIEGLSYEMVNGEPQFTDFVKNNPDGLSPNEALRSIGAQPNLPWIRASSGPMSKFTQTMLELEPKFIDQVKKVEPYMVLTTPFAMASAEESAEVARLESDFLTYVKEAVAQFISGQRDIETTFDKFVSDLYSLGLEDLIKIKQAQYDRATGK